MTAPATTRPGARHLQLHLQRLDSGQLAITCPQAPGFTRLAAGPDQLWSATRAAFAEVTRTGRAAWFGARDVDARPARALRPPREGVSWSKNAACRPDLVDTGAWLPLPDGSWLSPSGKRYRAPRIVNSIMARRARLGLATSFDTAAAQAEKDPEESARFWARVAEALREPVSRWHTSDPRNRQAAS